MLPPPMHTPGGPPAPLPSTVRLLRLRSSLGNRAGSSQPGPRMLSAGSGFGCAHVSLCPGASAPARSEDTRRDAGCCRLTGSSSGPRTGCPQSMPVAGLQLQVCPGSPSLALVNARQIPTHPTAFRAQAFPNTSLEPSSSAWQLQERSVPVFQRGRVAMFLSFRVCGSLGYVQARGQDAARSSHCWWAGLGAGQDLCLLRTMTNSSRVLT